MTGGSGSGLQRNLFTYICTVVQTMQVLVYYVHTGHAYCMCICTYSMYV